MYGGLVIAAVLPTGLTLSVALLCGALSCEWWGHNLGSAALVRGTMAGRLVKKLCGCSCC